MTRLIFIRHGYSKANEEKVFAGSYDTPLTELGIKQAELTAKYVYEKYAVDKIYSSDLKRASDTAMALCELCKKEPILSTRLREINGGKWEKKSYELLPIEYSKDYFVWKSDIGRSVCTGGESVMELYERINYEVDRIISENEGKTVVIVTHATPIRVFTTRVLGYGYERTGDVEWVPNASVSEFVVKNGKIEPVMLGENSFHGNLTTNLPSFK